MRADDDELAGSFRLEPVDQALAAPAPSKAFHLTELALALSDEIDSRQPDRCEWYRGRVPKILIVDDDPMIRRIVDAALRTRGHETVFAADASSALDLAAREHPDLVVLDLGLPDGSGLDVLASLKSVPYLAGVPVIVLSALTADVYSRRALAAGAEKYVDKSRGPGALLDAVAAVLGESNTP